MTQEVESLEEMLALQEKIGKLVESGWSDDPDDHYALRLMWYAGRDYQHQQAGAAVNDELVKALEGVSHGEDEHRCWCPESWFGVDHAPECHEARAALARARGER